MANVRKKNLLGFPVKSLSVTRYTKKAWEKCYPKASAAEWEILTKPYSVAEFAGSFMNEFSSENMPSTCRVVTIDEEYFEWLGNRENTNRARADYAQSVSDKDALRLLKKNDFDLETSYLFLPICIINAVGKMPAVTDYRFSANVRKNIRKQLSEVFDANVIVAPFIIDADTMVNMPLSKCNKMFEHLEMAEKGLPVSNMDEFKYQHHKEPTNIVVAVVPVIIQARMDSATIDFDREDDAFIRAVYPEEVDIEIAIPGGCMDIDVDVFAIPPLCTKEDIPEMQEVVLNSLAPIKKSSWSPVL